MIVFNAAGEILYTLFIWPVRFILEFLFVLFNRIFDAPGASVIFLSMVVNTLTLPIYAVADRWQQEERELQKRMKGRLDRIRSAFRGDERQMMIHAYYRQKGYSPLSPLRASMGLLLQIPFFIAAYQFLSRSSLLAGSSFLFFRDLGAPDLLIPLGMPGLPEAVNLLPLIMTVLNLASSCIYARGLEKRELIQLFAMALAFLVLLYHSPSGLVLYWTVNNLYSLVKNAAMDRLKNPGRVLYGAVFFFAGLFLFFIWSGRANVERYSLLFTFAALLFMALPPVWRFLSAPLAERFSGRADRLYVSAVVFLFLLLGFLNPAQVLSSSVSDFENPWIFMGRTFLQGAAFLVLVPLFIRALAPEPLRRVLAAGAAAAGMVCGFCYFVLAKSYGLMDRDFRLDDTEKLLYAFPGWVSAAVPLGALALTAAFIILRRGKFLVFFFQAAALAILLTGSISLVSLGIRASGLVSLRKTETLPLSGGGLSGIFPLSQRETNVFIVFFDRAQGSAFSMALEYMPSLRESLEGFTFYPNTLSFGSCTVTGVPAMLGGYGYTPLAINERETEPLTVKVNEALTALPRLFGAAGYRVLVTDPVIANMQSVPDTSIFRDIPNVSARLLSGKLAGRFREEFPGGNEEGIFSFDFDILFRYGLFRAAPPALRYGIHYKGQWWREAAYNSYGRAAAEFSSLYYLPELCSVDGGAGTLNIFMNAVTHESGAYNADLFPQSRPVLFTGEERERYGSANNAQYMYTLLAAMKQFVKWLEYLKSRDVYDNTRIILVSDHGGHYDGGSDLVMESYNPLLMVKEPGARGPLEISAKLMTHADTPGLAAAGLFPAGIKGTLAGGGEKTGRAGHYFLYAVAETSSQPLRHGPYKFNLEAIRKLTGEDMLAKESWENWRKLK
ncbi:MAG: membrane protein insertase YidC [Treponema sp.]|jgi:YidC/Oxa1 family membrane protein insertase|nr:membrane protein insertase YidC [Treponema sp.]